MFKKAIILGAFLFCLNVPAWAGNNPVDALTSNPWSYYALIYDPATNTADWHKGEFTFYPNNTVDLRTTNSSGNFDPTTTVTLKYAVDVGGKLEIMSTDPQDIYPYIGGQLNIFQDKISAVVTINGNHQSSGLADPSAGNVVLLRESTVPFSTLDLMGQWGGTAFTDNGGSSIGWISINSLSIDANGNIKGNDTRYDGTTGSFTGTATIDQNGQIKMTIANVQDPNYPIVMTAQMSKNRDVISADFNSPVAGQVSLGIGLLLKE